MGITFLAYYLFSLLWPFAFLGILTGRYTRLRFLVACLIAAILYIGISHVLFLTGLSSVSDTPIYIRLPVTVVFMVPFVAIGRRLGRRQPTRRVSSPPETVNIVPNQEVSASTTLTTTHADALLNPDKQSEALHPLVGCIAVAGGLIIGIYSLWCTVIAFKGGIMPITGWYLPGGLRHGLIWLFLIDPLVCTVAYWAFMALLIPIATAMGDRRATRKEIPAALGEALVFVLLLYGTYQCRDHIRDFITGKPLNTNQVPTATATPSPIEPTPSWSSYYDDKARVTLSFPGGWKFQTGPATGVTDWETGAPQYSISFYPEGPEALPQVNIFVLKGHGVPSGEVAHSVKAFLTQYETLLGQDDRLSNITIDYRWEQLTVDSQPAMALSYSASIDGISDVFAITMVTATDKDFYVITWSSSFSERDQTIARFEDMLKTIRFLH